MRLSCLFLFLTFVGLFASGAPTSEIAPAPIQTKDVQTPSTKGPVEQESLQWTDVPVISLSPRRNRQVSDAANSFGVGMLSGVLNQEKNQKSVPFFHLQRTHYNLDDGAQEFGFFFASGDFTAIGIDWGYKKLCCFTSFASAFDPFYKVGLAGIFEPKDRLANFIDHERYFLQLSGGFENLFYFRRSLRLETGLRYGVPGFHAFAQLSYSFPD